MFGTLTLFSRSYWHLEIQSFIEKKFVCTSLQSMSPSNFENQICSEKNNLCAHYPLNQWLELDQN